MPSSGELDSYGRVHLHPQPTSGSGIDDRAVMKASG